MSDLDDAVQAEVKDLRNRIAALEAEQAEARVRELVYLANAVDWKDAVRAFGPVELQAFQRFSAALSSSEEKKSDE